jgi:hypothetical protein
MRPVSFVDSFFIDPVRPHKLQKRSPCSSSGGFYLVNNAYNDSIVPTSLSLTQSLSSFYFLELHNRSPCYLAAFKTTGSLPGDLSFLGNP